MTAAGVAGVVLCGGAGRRMGGRDKGAIRLAGQTLRDRVVARLEPQVEALALSTGARDGGEALPALPRLKDAIPGGRGPLAGILAAVLWAQAQHYPWVLTVPVDGPFLPLDLRRRLEALAEPGVEIVASRSGDRLHPTASLWRTSLAPLLAAALAGPRSPPTRDIILSRSHRVAIFETRPLDPFFNVNTPEDLAEAERLLAQEAAGPGPSR